MPPFAHDDDDEGCSNSSKRKDLRDVSLTRAEDQPGVAVVMAAPITQQRETGLQ